MKKRILVTTTSFQDTPGYHHKLLNDQNFEIDYLRGPLKEITLLPIIHKYDGVICAAAPREYPHELVDSLNVSAKIVIPVGNSKSQKLNVINKISSNEVEQDLYDDVSFVPMLPGKSEDGLDS